MDGSRAGNLAQWPGGFPTVEAVTCNATTDPMTCPQGVFQGPACTGTCPAGTSYQGQPDQVTEGGLAGSLSVDGENA